MPDVAVIGAAAVGGGRKRGAVDVPHRTGGGLQGVGVAHGGRGAHRAGNVHGVRLAGGGRKDAHGVGAHLVVARGVDDLGDDVGVLARLFSGENLGERPDLRAVVKRHGSHIVDHGRVTRRGAHRRARLLVELGVQLELGKDLLVQIGALVGVDLFQIHQIARHGGRSGAGLYRAKRGGGVVRHNRAAALHVDGQVVAAKRYAGNVFDSGQLRRENRSSHGKLGAVGHGHQPGARIAHRTCGLDAHQLAERTGAGVVRAHRGAVYHQLAVVDEHAACRAARRGEAYVKRALFGRGVLHGELLGNGDAELVDSVDRHLLAVQVELQLLVDGERRRDVVGNHLDGVVSLGRSNGVGQRQVFPDDLAIAHDLRDHVVAPRDLAVVGSERLPTNIGVAGSVRGCEQVGLIGDGRGALGGCGEHVAFKVGAMHEQLSVGGSQREIVGDAERLAVVVDARLARGFDRACARKRHRGALGVDAPRVKRGKLIGGNRLARHNGNACDRKRHRGVVGKDATRRGLGAHTRNLQRRCVDGKLRGVVSNRAAQCGRVAGNGNLAAIGHGGRASRPRGLDARGRVGLGLHRNGAARNAQRAILSLRAGGGGAGGDVHGSPRKHQGALGVVNLRANGAHAGVLDVDGNAVQDEHAGALLHNGNNAATVEGAGQDGPALRINDGDVGGSFAHQATDGLAVQVDGVAHGRLVGTGIGSLDGGRRADTLVQHHGLAVLGLRSSVLQRLERNGLAITYDMRDHVHLALEHDTVAGFGQSQFGLGRCHAVGQLR